MKPHNRAWFLSACRRPKRPARRFRKWSPQGGFRQAEVSSSPNSLFARPRESVRVRTHFSRGSASQFESELTFRDGESLRFRSHFSRGQDESLRFRSHFSRGQDQSLRFRSHSWGAEAGAGRRSCRCGNDVVGQGRVQIGRVREGRARLAGGAGPRRSRWEQNWGACVSSDEGPLPRADAALCLD